MAEVTYFVALPFVAADDGVAAGEPTECFNPVAVAMRAEALSRKPGHVGAVAFSRTGDPATGDFDAAGRSGQVSFGYEEKVARDSGHHALGPDGCRARKENPWVCQRDGRESVD
jgi:hypothetical protein